MTRAVGLEAEQSLQQLCSRLTWPRSPDWLRVDFQTSTAGRAIRDPLNAWEELPGDAGPVSRWDIGQKEPPLVCPGRRVSYRLSQLGSPVHLPSGPRVGQGSVLRAICCCPWPPATLSSVGGHSAPKMLLESQTAGWERSRHQFPGTWDSPFRNTPHGPGLGPQVLPVPPLPPGPGAKEVGSACSPGGPLPTSLV